MSKHVMPPDPDGINNDRAAWAGECIQLMADITGCEPGQEALGDLVCNLFHWGDRNGIPPDEMRNIIENRFEMYRQETAPLPDDFASCAKCGKVIAIADAITDEGEGEESGRTFTYCSTQCMETH